MFCGFPYKQQEAFYLYNTLQQCTVLNCVVRYYSVLFSLFSSLPLFYGPVSSRDNRVFNGPLGRSLRSFARTAHSAHSLRSAPLRYARFATLASLARSVHGLAHSLRSLPRGTVVIHEYVFTLKSCFTGTNAILVVTGNTPYMC